ncbi:MAG: PhzF family phenazine biosynthesis protein [Nocardioides sp.]|uniref:PhzF family phenazine biosynthesis protein n=1 Tax=Nocardioides sp. TaxID=35761 RepID=UPI0039E4D322
MSRFDFRQVDVFSAEPLRGNPVAVVHDAESIAEPDLAAFARWTNLSETTFLLPPTTPAADYRVRILTPGAELPFAGHPTLGTAHAWLEAGGVPREDREIVQECGVGLVRVRRGADRLAFAAPELLRSGPVDAADLARIAAGLRLRVGDLQDAQWIDNGPGWVGVLLADADAVLRVRPDPVALGDLAVGIAGIYPEGECAIEVRAFVGGIGVDEDPVTGSLNAGLAQWLAGGLLPASYVASQGTVLQRRGRVHIDTDEDGTIWVGGETVTTISGTLSLPDPIRRPVSIG